MKAKKWLAAFLGTCLALAALVAGINIAVDPFGVFGDHLLNWYSYNETNNPRVAKTAYLEQNHDKYDSYIIGCSSTSSFPVETANAVFDASFYNTIVYGADMLDSEQFARYLIDNYEVKNIILNAHILNSETYDVESDPLTYRMHEKMTGENPLLFYGRYAFANLNYALDKLSARKNDTYLNQTFDVFNEQTGAYDKLARDTEYISDLDSYLAANTEFTSYTRLSRSLPQIENCMKSVAAIRDMCEEAGVNLIVVAAPLYYENLADYNEQDVKDYFCALAEVTPYWDFSMSSISFEPRYFYDTGHMRNFVGTMALMRIGDVQDLYIPQDFGTYVTADNVAAHVETLFTATALPAAAYTVDVPILMYHNITPDTDGDDMNITPEVFEAQLDALLDAGYQTISLLEMGLYMRYGAELPENPILITFDDGYLSNYEYAYPALRERGMKASFFVIGVSMGKDTYKDTGHEMNPHFSMAQAQEMLDSGLIEVQSHTYDMHQWAPFEENEPVRSTVAQLDGESESDYIAALREDSEAFQSAAKNGGIVRAFAFAYPEGDANRLAEAILYEEGYVITLRTERGISTIVRGLPQSLLGMKRIEVNGAWRGNVLLETIESYRLS